MGDRLMGTRVVVQNQFAQIQGPFPDTVRRVTSYAVQGAFFSASFQKRRPDGSRAWDGRRRLLLEPESIFPAGLLDRVRAAMEEAGCPPEIADLTDYPPPLRDAPVLFDIPGEGKLRDYQLEGIARALERRRGILKIATGGGKTVLAAGLISQLGRPSVILVESIDLLRQTVAVLERHLRQPVGVIGDGRWVEAEFTVASVGTLAARLAGQGKAFLRSRQLVIYDEVHHGASDTSFKVLMACPAAWRIGLSATPTGRSDGADLKTTGALGPVIFEVCPRELVAAGVLVRPVVEFVPVDEPLLPCAIDYQTAYRLGIVENQQRHRLAAARVKQYLDAGLHVLVLVRQIDHGRALLAALHDVGVTAEFVFGAEHGTEERGAALDRLRDGRLRCLVASEIFDEGVDAPAIDALVLAGGGKSEIRTIQRLGRGMRGGKRSPVLHVCDFADMTDPRLARHALQRLRTYRRQGVDVRYAPDAAPQLELLEDRTPR